MRSRSLLAVVFGSALATWTACTGDEPVDTGTLADGGASTSGTSNGDTGTSSGTSGTGTSSGTSGEPFDGGDGDCRDLTRPTSPLVCPKGPNEFQNCAAGDLCCPGRGCLKGATNCGGDLGDGADEWQCFGPAHCTNDTKCYIRQARLDPSDGGAECGVTGAITLEEAPYLSVGRCLGNPPSSPWAQLCQVEADCENPGPCLPTFVVAGGAKILVKACVN